MATADVVTREVTKTRLKEPGKFKVIFINDDFTPMDFVIALLIEVFKHSTSAALKLTQDVHEKGSAVVGTYTYEIAEQKGIEATTIARDNGHPLVIKVEAE